MLDLQKIKKYLRVDYNEDDELLNQYITVAENFLYNITGKVEEDSDVHYELLMQNVEVEMYSEGQIALADIYMLALISELYNNKSITVEKAEQKVRYVMQSILNQLMY